MENELNSELERNTTKIKFSSYQIRVHSHKHENGKCLYNYGMCVQLIIFRPNLKCWAGLTIVADVAAATGPALGEQNIFFQKEVKLVKFAEIKIG